MNLSYALARSGFKALFRLCYRWKAVHAERVPAEGPVLLASNHASFIDPPAVGAGLGRMINFLARDSLFRAPILGSLIRSWRAIPVDREGGGASGINAVLERLSRGGMVLLFIEGTRTRDGNLQTPRAGVGLIAIRSKAPVVPVRLFGTFDAWSRHRRFPRLLGEIGVTYGEPLRFEALKAEAATCSKPRLKEIYQEAAAAIMDAITRLEPPPRP